MSRLCIVIACLFFVCLGATYAYAQDSDGDGMPDSTDNCPATPNGPELGSCVVQFVGIVLRTGGSCTGSADCAPEATCQMQQADINANGIGDVCECYADGNHDTMVNIMDFVAYKNERGRNDCSPLHPCQADHNGDGRVNLKDLGILKMEYGRYGCPIPQ